MENVEILLDQAMEASDQGDDAKAITIYEQILLQKEDWSAPHYNLGLIYKYQNLWEKSFYHNSRAVALNPEDQAAHWNLGIAATMLGQWKVARQSWNVFGLNYEINDEDTAGNVGISPVRINPEGDAEIVWATRLCPARAEIYSIPFPESGYGFLDLVLNDGAPNGYRMLNDREYAVFDVLQPLKKSSFQTFSIKCKPLPDSDLEKLRNRCREARIGIENWTMVEMLCKQCSEGKPHETHDHDLKGTPEAFHIALAATSEDQLDTLLNAWADETGVEFYDPISYPREKFEDPA